MFSILLLYYSKNHVKPKSRALGGGKTYQSQRGIFKLVDIEGFLKLVLLRSLGAVHYRIMEISDIRLWQLDIGILGYWVPATADIGADIDWLRQG